jgi:hypothetical protein
MAVGRIPPIPLLDTLRTRLRELALQKYTSMTEAPLPEADVRSVELEVRIAQPIFF